MSLSDPRRVVVQATNMSGITLQTGAVVHVVNSNSSVVEDAPLRYARIRNYGAGSPQGRECPTVGVVVSERDTVDGDTMSVCIQGACFAFCDANGANIDSTDYLFVTDSGIGGTQPGSLTNNPALSRTFDGLGVNAALIPGGAGTFTEQTWITATRARASDPTGGPTNNGLTLLAGGSQGMLPVIIVNNPGTNAE